MANGKITVGKDRLPTLEVLGKEWPYDVTRVGLLEQLDRIQKIDLRDDGLDLNSVVELYAGFIRAVFCDSDELIKELREVVGDSLQLWADIAVQVAGFVQTAGFNTILDRLAGLKAAADGNATDNGA